MTGVTFKIPPLVSILPTFGVLLQDIIASIKTNIALTPRSCLILSGKSKLENLSLDGSLWIKNEEITPLEVTNLKISDSKYVEFEGLKSYKNQMEKTRGFEAHLGSLQVRTNLQ